MAQQRKLVPLQLAVVVIVGLSALVTSPRAGLHGRALGITVTATVFVVGFLVARHRRCQPVGVQVAVLLFTGGAGDVLAWQQPQAAAELAAAAVVLVASARLPSRVSTGIAVPVVTGLGFATAAHADADAETVAASVLLCVVLTVLGALVRQARVSQDRTEMLLAELEEARDDQARAAAIEERSRIARELHDVLAHSLSALSIQLEGARKLAGRDGVTDELAVVIDRSATLAKQGLVEARGAVGALRDEELMSVRRLPELVEHYARDLGLSVEYRCVGPERPLAADTSVTLYRVAGEALTNVLRHAPGATAQVVLTWEPDEVRLRVCDSGDASLRDVAPAHLPVGDEAASESARDASALPEAPLGAQTSGGWGLIGLRERVNRVNGRCSAGPDGSGWVVDVTVPA